MNLEDETEVRLIQLWMKAPDPKPHIAERLAEQLKRARQAHSFMVDEPVRRKVIPQLMLLYAGKDMRYSESTAERDIQYAERLFRTVSQHTAKYMMGLELDFLVESRIGAMHDRKWGEVARLEKVMLEFFKAIEAEDLDKETLRRPVIRLLKFEPEALGVKRNLKLKERIMEVLQKKKEKDPVQRMLGAIDAEFEETKTDAGD